MHPRYRITAAEEELCEPGPFLLAARPPHTRQGNVALTDPV